MTSANDRQVDGDHYKKHGKTGEQHWDRQYRIFGPGYFIGCATKYVERYRDKNGLRDLEKAKHFIEKLIELEIENPSCDVVRKQTLVSLASSSLTTTSSVGLVTAKVVSAEEGGSTRGYVNQDR